MQHKSTVIGIVVKKQSNLDYTRDITSKRVTSGGAHFRRTATGQDRNVLEPP